VAIPSVIFANGGMEVPVSNGGGPLVELMATGLPDTIETFGRADPEEVEVISGAAAEGRPEEEGVGVGALGVEGEEGRGVGVVGAGVGGACLFRRWSRCLAFSFSAFTKESC